MALLTLIACFGAPSGGDPGGDDSGSGPGDDSADPGADTAPPVEAEVVALPGGSFVMGCDDCDADEAPAHAVTLSPFAVDRYEVTHHQYAACVAAGACPAPPGGPGEADLPVTGVSFDEASGFCAWRGMRPPTEAEWEFAARGAEGRRHPWGDAEPTCALVATRACSGGLEPVGRHPDGATPEGVHDLAGNAWEWVADWYDPDWYAESPAEDPQGPTTPGLRTVRGIELWSDLGVLRASNREYAIPDGRGVLVGFRCVEDR